MSLEKDSTATAWTVPPSMERTLPLTESVLDLKLINFYTCLQITPNITEFHDNNDSYVSNQSSDISDIEVVKENEATLKQFLEAFWRP